MSNAVECVEVGAERVVGLACDVAPEAADNVAFVEAFCGAAVRVGAGAGAVAEAADGDHVQGPVSLSVAGGVEPVPCGAPGGGGDQGGGADLRERGLVLEPLDVLARGDEQLLRVSRARANIRSRRP
jgi:hypothetical protein